jgi:hypothetical protein
MLETVAHEKIDLFAGSEEKLRLTPGAFEGKMHIQEIGYVGRADGRQSR